MSITSSDPKTSEAKRSRRRGCLIVLSVFAVLLGAYASIFFSDIGPRDDSDLRPPPPADVPDEKNMAYWWSEALIDLEFTTFEAISKNNWLGDPRFDPKKHAERVGLLDAFVSANQDRFAAIDRAAECTEIVQSRDFAQWTTWYGIQDLIAAGAHHAMVLGDGDRALELLLKSRYLLQTRGFSTGGVVASPSITRAWIHLIRTETSASALRVWLTRVDDPILNDDWYVEWAQHNYQLMTEFLEHPEAVKEILETMSEFDSRRGLSHRWLYRPNRTRAQAAAAYREYRERGRRGERFEAPAPPEGWHRIRRILGGNYAGEELLDKMLESIKFYEDETLAVIATDRMLRTAIALRIRKLETGRFPRQLTDLVPDLLTDVPLDPEDAAGGPLRWDPNRRVLWTVGPDRVDHGGEIWAFYMRRTFVDPLWEPNWQDRALKLRH